ncbi:glycosyltransferase family 4 protein [Pseudarthrobacter sp. J1738]|uniref:glycosyltransferase family 4 protein n=1 Tax=Pseudarthrobacter sp. J1738 TaxID=3420446 RepID=UPI003D293F11
MQNALDTALSKSISGSSAVRLADLALAAGCLEQADSLALNGAQAPNHAAFIARRFWYDGAMTAAVEHLKLEEAKHGGSRSAKRLASQRRRLESELKVFTGFLPVLTPREHQPRKRTVMHVLTNSLPHTGSGYAQRTHSILTAQRDLGWNVSAVTRLGYPVQVGKVLASGADSVDGIDYVRINPGRLKEGMAARLQQQAELVADEAVRRGASVLHTTTHFTNALVTAAAADALGIPWVYEVRGQLADTWASTRGPEAIRSERFRLFREREADVMKRADLVVTLGEAMRANIVDAGVDSANILVAPNAVGGAFLDEPMTQQDARRQLGLAEDALMIGTVSSLVDYEGLDTLLRAAALLIPRFSKLRVLIVGDGVSAPSLRALAQELGISAQTIFTGRVPRNLTPIYHAALDVFVVPRIDSSVTRDVTPLKPVEAMASARPVVASDLPALRELLAEGETGMFAQAENPASLASSIDRLLVSPQKRYQLGRRARQVTLLDRTWKANAKRALSAYDRLTKNGG